MKARIDYHFHANLPKCNKKAALKCKQIWSNLEKDNINILISTEHAYKNPKRAFEMLYKFKPKHLYCFPGVECITKEGIDIIVFSKDQSIYEYHQLESFNESYFDLIEFVNSRNDLHAFVTHPHTLGLTSVINKLGKDAYFQSLKMLNAVEISNGAFDNLILLSKKLPFLKLFKSKIKQMHNTQCLPLDDYPSQIQFLAAGSDAHHVEEIGNCYEVSSTRKTLNEKEAFEIVTRNAGKGKVILDDYKSFSFKLLIKTAFTVMHEFLIKQKLKFKKRSQC